MTSPGPDWVEQARRFVVSSGLGEVFSAGRSTGGEAPAGPSGDHPAECRRCPVCVGVAVLQGRRPDLVEGLADVLGTAAAVLRAHAAGAAAAGGPAPAPGATPPPGEHPDQPTTSAADAVSEEPVTPQPPPVQRIEVA